MTNVANILIVNRDLHPSLIGATMQAMKDEPSPSLLHMLDTI